MHVLYTQQYAYGQLGCVCTFVESSATCEDGAKAGVRPTHCLVYAKEHLPVELTCQWEFIENVIGIKWLFNNHEVLTLLARDGDFKHNRTTCRGSYSYVIPEFNSSYVGNYTCQVYTWIDPRVPFSGRYTVLLEDPTGEWEGWGYVSFSSHCQAC